MVRVPQRLSVLWPRHRGVRIAAALVYVLAIAVATGELLGWRSVSYTHLTLPTSDLV